MRYATLVAAMAVLFFFSAPATAQISGSSLGKGGSTLGNGGSALGSGGSSLSRGTGSGVQGSSLGRGGSSLTRGGLGSSSAVGRTPHAGVVAGGTSNVSSRYARNVAKSRTAGRYTNRIRNSRGFSGTKLP